MRDPGGLVARGLSPPGPHDASHRERHHSPPPRRRLRAGSQSPPGLGSASGQTHHRLRTTRLPVLGARAGRPGDRRRGRSGMAPHQLSTRLTTVTVLDAVGARAVPFEHFDRFGRLGRREPVGGLDSAEQPDGAALHRPRLPAPVGAHAYCHARREPVVNHCPSAARRLRPRTDRAGLAGPVSRQLRGDRRRSVLDPARHGPEHPGFPARTGHDDRRPGAITMNRHASAPTPSTADIERRPDPPHTPCPPGTPPTVRSPL